MDGSDEARLRHARVQILPFRRGFFSAGRSEGRKKDGTARWRVGGAASYAAAALHRHVTTVVIVVMPTAPRRWRDARCLALRRCVSRRALLLALRCRKPRICMKRSAGAHASTARRDASLGEATACSVRIRCQGRSARQQQRCFGYQPQRRWQLDDDDGRCTGTEACPPGTGNVVL